MRVLRMIFALAAICAAAWCVGSLPVLDGPPGWNFIGFMLLPIGAAFALAPRTLRLAFIAGAFYAGLAGLRRMLVPEGNDTASEQLSTAALVSMLVPILQQLGERMVRSVTRSRARQK